MSQVSSKHSEGFPWPLGAIFYLDSLRQAGHFTVDPVFPPLTGASTVPSGLLTRAHSDGSLALHSMPTLERDLLGPAVAGFCRRSTLCMRHLVPMRDSLVPIYPIIPCQAVSLHLDLLVAVVIGKARGLAPPK